MPKNEDDKPEKPWDAGVEHIRKEERPDFSKPPPHKNLPKELQATLDDDDKLFAALYQGTAGESTDSSVRYAGYAGRIRTIMMSAQRYVAYTSDIGESFRPIAHPYIIRAAYGVSWGYIAGDVVYEGYKARIRNDKILDPSKRTDEEKAGWLGTEPDIVPAIHDARAVMAERAIFQSLASMGLPAFTIHSIVRYSGKALKNNKNAMLRTWGPVGLGIAAVPALPYLFDKPVEQAVSWAFHTAFKAIGGPEAVVDLPLQQKKPVPVPAVPGKTKEKEL